MWNKKEVHWLHVGYNMWPWPLTSLMTLTCAIDISSCALSGSFAYLHFMRVPMGEKFLSLKLLDGFSLLEFLWNCLDPQLCSVRVICTLWACSWTKKLMMTSSNGNIFPVTGHLCGEFTSHRWIPHPMASDVELWCFLCLNKRLSKQSWGWWFETPSRPLWRHSNVYLCNHCMDFLCLKFCELFAHLLPMGVPMSKKLYLCNRWIDFLHLKLCGIV